MSIHSNVRPGCQPTPRPPKVCFVFLFATCHFRTSANCFLSLCLSFIPLLVSLYLVLSRSLSFFLLVLDLFPFSLPFSLCFLLLSVACLLTTWCLDRVEAQIKPPPAAAASSAVTSAASKAKVVCKAKVLYDYTASNREEEIDLAEGDIIAVEYKAANGWWVGKNERTQNSGIFPGTYVEEER